MKKPKSFTTSSLGYIALIIGGLIVKFSLVMWVGVTGYTLIAFGLVLLLSLHK